MKLALILLAATALGQTPAPEPQTVPYTNGTSVMLNSSSFIVAETDEHGCVSGQGYTWDESVKGCAITVRFTASRTLTCKITAQDVNKQTVTCWYTPTPGHKEPK